MAGNETNNIFCVGISYIFYFFLVFTFRRATATFTLFTENDPSRVPIPLKRPAFFLMAIIPFNASHSVQVHEFMSS